MKTVKIDSNSLKDWNAFHDVFSKEFDFPSYYGRNMNAWIDCMDEFIKELTLIDLGDCREVKERKPEIIQAINECSTFVNFRRIAAGEPAVLIISMFV